MNILSSRLTDGKRPMHPGKLVGLELKERSISQDFLAQAIFVSRQTVSRLINGHQRMTLGMILRLTKFFGYRPDVWIALQEDIDLWEAYKKNKKIYNRIEIHKRSQSNGNK